MRQTSATSATLATPGDVHPQHFTSMSSSKPTHSLLPGIIILSRHTPPDSDAARVIGSRTAFPFNIRSSIFPVLARSIPCIPNNTWKKSCRLRAVNAVNASVMNHSPRSHPTFVVQSHGSAEEEQRCNLEEPHRQHNSEIKTRTLLQCSEPRLSAGDLSSVRFGTPTSRLVVGERPCPVPYRVEPAAVEGILDPPNGFRIMNAKESLPDSRQEAVTDSRGDNVGEEQRRQDGRAEGLDNLQSSCQERVMTFARFAESQVHECVRQCQDRQEYATSSTTRGPRKPTNIATPMNKRVTWNKVKGQVRIGTSSCAALTTRNAIGQSAMFMVGGGIRSKVLVWVCRGNSQGHLPCNANV